MKDLFENWRSFLLAEGLSDYNVSGVVRLFHYSKSEDESIVLDPEYFLNKRHSYSRKDYQASDLPRVFFYANLDHAEEMVKQGATLYTVLVPVEEIYDLVQDRLGLIKKSIVPGRVTPNVDLILRSLAGVPRQSKYGPPPELILSDDQRHSGAFYKTGNMDVVVWFKEIEVKRFDPENVETGVDNEEG